MMKALVLTSGGARGFAQVGGLKVLERIGFSPDIIVGSSMGGAISALYASGKTAEELETLSKEFSFVNVLDMQVFGNGFVKGSRIREYFKEQIGDKRFDELEITLVLNAVDINNGEEVVFETGSVLDGVRSTVSIPGLIKPAEINGRHLVDPGFTVPVPIGNVPEGCDVVVFDTVQTVTDLGDNLRTHDILLQVLRIGAERSANRDISDYRKKNDRNVIHIDFDIDDRYMLDFREIPSLIQKGEESVKKRKADIKKIV